MTGAYTINRAAGRCINRLAIDKHAIARFNAQARIRGIG
jgi:hypothetical protein